MPPNCACAAPADRSADPESARVTNFNLRMSLLLQLGRRRWWNTGSQLAGSAPTSAEACTAIGVVSARPDSTDSSSSRPVRPSSTTKIGRASSGERVWKYVEIWEVRVSLKKKKGRRIIKKKK